MPDWAREVRTRLSSLQLSPARESEFVEELSEHLDDRWRELIAGGEPSNASGKRIGSAGWLEIVGVVGPTILLIKIP